MLVSSEFYKYLRCLYFSAFLLEIQLDLGDGAVLYKRNETVNKMGQIPEASLPRLGDSLRVELTEVPTDGKVCRLIFYRNEEVIGQFQQPRLRYIVSLESKRGLSVMIHPLMQDVSHQLNLLGFFSSL